MLPLEVPSSDGLFNRPYSFPLTELYNPRAFITHAASLDQAFAHCPRFPTAASRRSLDRVSVPVSLIVLSDQLAISALVSRYLTNKLMVRGPIHRRQPEPPLATESEDSVVLRSISPSLDRLSSS